MPFRYGFRPIRRRLPALQHRQFHGEPGRSAQAHWRLGCKEPVAKKLSPQIAQINADLLFCRCSAPDRLRATHARSFFCTCGKQLASLVELDAELLLGNSAANSRE